MVSNLIKCYKCGKEYDPREHNMVLPDNFQIWGVKPDEKIPQCPGCGTADFMDIAARQLANDPRFQEAESE